MTQVIVNHIHHSFRGRPDLIEVLKDVNFNVDPQQFLCLLGPSGCGKTTLLKIIANLVRPESGSIEHCQSDTITQPQIGMVFQQANLMPWRNVIDNVILPLEIMYPDLPKKIMKEKATDLLEMVGLTGYENMWVRELSGGMAQRAALARALIHDPSLLLLDEPFGSLDALTREEMGEELLRIWQNYKKTVIMVTHSITEALLLSDRIIVLSNPPATIKLDMTVPFQRPRDPEIRYSLEFLQYSERIHKAIGNK